MEWLTKILEGKVAEGELESVVDALKKEMPLHTVPKYKYNEVSDAKKELEANIKDRDKQLNELKSASGDSEELKATIEKLQNENKEAKVAYENKVRDIQVSSAIENSLKEAKAKHPDLLLGKIDKSLVSLGEDGAIKGLSEQLETLKTSYADLFEAATTPPAKPAVQGFVPVNKTGSDTQGGPVSDGAKLAQMFNQTQSTAVAVDPWKI